MKKKTSALKYVCAVLFTIFVTGLISLGIANPYSQAQDSGVSAAPSGTEPPTISIFSPLNNIVYDSNNVSLTFKVSVGKPANTSGMGIHSIYYRADWLEKDIYVNSFDLSERDSEFFDNLTLTGIPFGYHTIAVYATEIGRYFPDYFHFYRYYVTGSSLVGFTVKTIDNATTAHHESKAPSDVAANPPIVEILNPQNSTAFKTTDINIDFKVGVGKSDASA